MAEGDLPPTNESTAAPLPCPTPCDPDCDATCHEMHHPRWKWSHQPGDCPAIGGYEPGTHAVPPGCYEVFADDDDVIGLTVGQTSPHGYFLVRVDPPFMDAFDEYEVARFLAWCLTNARSLVADPVEGLLAATAPVHVTACPTCGGAGTVNQ